MNKEQCERALALYQQLDECNLRIGGLEKPHAMSVTVEFDAEGSRHGVTVHLDLKNQGRAENAVQEALLGVFRTERTRLRSDLRAVTGEEAA